MEDCPRSERNEHCQENYCHLEKDPQRKVSPFGHRVIVSQFVPLLHGAMIDRQILMSASSRRLAFGKFPNADAVFKALARLPDYFGLNVI